MSSPSPGGSGAVLGTKVLRYSGIQGALLFSGNLLTFASVVVVAFFLGPAEFGRFALLLFLAGLLNILFNLATKQGTFKRVFGMSDDDDEDEGDGDAAPEGADRHSLGTGLWLTTIVSVVGTLVVIAFARPIADLLLGDPSDSRLVVFAAITGGLGAIFRLSSLVLWLERRPSSHVAAETVKPLLILAAVVAFVAGGAGIEGAIAGTALGTALSVALALFLLRGSYELRPSLAEAGLIVRRGAPRIPVVLSMWTLSNADIFILSRFVSDADLGIYQLAARTGIVVALLPGGFRIAMRPLRKSLTFKAVQDEYGRAVARGQQLNYFLLLCIVALFGVTLASGVLAHLAPSGYADAAPLVPLLAAGLMGTSVLRSTSQAVSIPNKRITFIFAAVSAALIFVGLALFLVPRIGLEGAPIAMLIGFSTPALYMLARSQFGKEPIRLAYGKLSAATLLAAAAAAGYALLVPDNGFIQLGLALALFLGYLVLLPALGIVPRQHWSALFQIVRSLVGRAPTVFDPAKALAGIDDADRVALRMAILKRRPVAKIPERLEQRGLESNGGGDPAEGGARVVAALRRAADEGGASVEDRRRRHGARKRSGGKAERQAREKAEQQAAERGDRAVGGTGDATEADPAAVARDASIAEYLFPQGTAAQRDARMRRLLSEGVASDELMALEAVVEDLAQAPREAWKGEG